VTIVWDLLYLTGLIMGGPLFVYRAIMGKKYRAGLGQKLGFVPRRPDAKKCVWLHAVSVGEIIAARTLVNAIQSELDDVEVLITTTTNTGNGVARRNHPDLPVHYFPIDFSFVVRRVLQRFNPSLIVLMELELWPNFLTEADRQGIPVVLVNGRISAKSYWVYKRSWPFLARALKVMDGFSVQTPTYARRLRKLGIPTEKILVTGNMKYDAVIRTVPESPVAERAALGIGSEELVFTAGSTHSGEEGAAFGAWRAAEQAAGGPVRLVVVPRAPERVKEVIRLLKGKGVEPVRKSEIQGPLAPGQVVVGDTMGEMMKIYSASDIVFVGGSLIPHGGQNMLEPAACGKAVLWGSSTENFTEAVGVLMTAGGGIRVRDADELAQQVSALACDAKERERLGRAAKAALHNKLGATEKNLDLVRLMLERGLKPPHR